MKRIQVLLAVVALVVPSAAHAKGPHAVLSSGSQSVEAGEPWQVTLELMETKGVARPVLLARRGDRVVAVRGRRVASDGWMTRYELDVVLPANGRWRVAVVDRERRFDFPPVAVGSGSAPRDYVAFPAGSGAERQGGGGPYQAPETSVGHGESLPPETISLAGAPRVDRDEGDSALWVLPLAGLVLAGAGAGVWRLRAR